MSKNRSGNSSVERDGDLIDFAMRIWNKTASEPYYLLHFLVFFSYIPIRFSAAGVLSPSRSAILLIREIQALVAFCILTVIKLVRDETWESFIANTFFFAKLETLLTEGNTSRFWLVEFRASSVSSCIRTSSFFPELSVTYSNKRVSFGTVDLGLFPNAAEKFGISLESLNQLPTYVLFDNGTEVSCLSEVDFGAKLFSPPLTKKQLCRHFELDKLLLDYVNGR